MDAACAAAYCPTAVSVSCASSSSEVVGSTAWATESREVACASVVDDTESEVSVDVWTVARGVGEW